MRVKEESGKAGLKLNIQNTKIMASDPITSWQREGEKVETVTDFIFLGSKITADSDCSQEVKRRLLLERKAITNLDSILLSTRHPPQNKGHIQTKSEGLDKDISCKWRPKESRSSNTHIRLNRL